MITNAPRALRQPGRAWALLSASIFLATLAAQAVPKAVLDWQPGLAATEPWRWWTALFVHFSPLHLGANLLGLVLVAMLGLSARVPWPVSAAWFAAWPLTHLALLLQPALRHYGGLSGVLHAAVAIVAVHLLAQRAGRWIGAAVLGGLCIKVVSESPWLGPVQHTAGWDIGVAPIAHACGLVVGIACALVAGFLSRTRPDD
ncbi:rhomboid family GlyGly-CTERM serine protease [Rhizobacter sp. OV335]|nr:rhomboid family GlyGly-CTERM serine protease [Rhizobacter sp. OV335]